VLATLEQLKARLNVAGGGSEDSVLTALLESASERVEHEAGRLFEPRPALVDGSGDPIVDPDPIVLSSQAFGTRWCLAHDLRVVDEILADGVDVTSSARLVRARQDDPAHALMLPAPAEVVTITGWFGFASVPPSIRDATLGWAQRAYHETRARMSDQSVDPDGGMVSYFRQVPPFVAVAVQHYQVPVL